MSIKNIFVRFKFFIFVFLMYLAYMYYTVIYNTEKVESYDGIIPDIFDDVYNPPPRGKSIFFIETSSNVWDEDWELNLTARQACSIESAAVHNPNMTIYVLFTSPRFYPNLTLCLCSACATVRELLKYKNIKMRSVNMTAYFESTPLEIWLRKGELWDSKSLVEHTSDVMRFLTLWKFGGTYLDLDVVVLKSFEDLAPNFAGGQSEELINCAVINFDHTSFGHELAELCLREINYNFRGDLWIHNGPGVITRVMNKICKTKKTHEMTPESCNGFQVLPESTFYPIKYIAWEWLFTPALGSYIIDKMNGSYAVHLWNKLSYKQKIAGPKNNKAAYTRLAEIKCPNVFKENNLVF